MSQPATRTRFLTLRDIFEARGIPPDHARAAAGVLNARYPVILAAGVAGVERRMRNRGVSMPEASRLAPTLLVFELLDRGGDLTQAVTLLTRHGLSEAAAQGHGLEAANLLRETANSLPQPIAKRVPWTRWLMTASFVVASALLAAASAL